MATKAMVYMVAIFAEYARTRISERTKAAFAQIRLWIVSSFPTPIHGQPDLRLAHKITRL
jgi:DNA invertase Pin-like site-specific DNA recombinase